MYSFIKFKVTKVQVQWNKRSNRIQALLTRFKVLFCFSLSFISVLLFFFSPAFLTCLWHVCSTCLSWYSQRWGTAWALTVPSALSSVCPGHHARELTGILLSLLSISHGVTRITDIDACPRFGGLRGFRLSFPCSHSTLCSLPSDLSLYTRFDFLQNSLANRYNIPGTFKLLLLLKLLKKVI